MLFYGLLLMCQSSVSVDVLAEEIGSSTDLGVFTMDIVAFVTDHTSSEVRHDIVASKLSFCSDLSIFSRLADATKSFELSFPTTSAGPTTVNVSFGVMDW